LLLLLVVSVAGSQIGTAIVHARAGDDVRATIKVIDDARARRDAGAIAPFVAADFQMWSRGGEPRTKADFLKSVSGREADLSRSADPVVRVYGDTAVYTARITDRGQRKDGAPFTVTTCVTTTFARIKGKWMMVAGHEAIVP